MDCNIVEVIILSFRSCEFLMFLNLSQRDFYVMFCLRTSKRVSLRELIDHGFYPLLGSKTVATNLTFRTSEEENKNFPDKYSSK